MQPSELWNRSCILINLKCRFYPEQVWRSSNTSLAGVEHKRRQPEYGSRISSSGAKSGAKGHVPKLVWRGTVPIGFRLQLHGHRCLYVPEAVVRHIGSATFGVRSDFALYHMHRNRISTFCRNMPSALLWRYLPAHLLLNAVYVFYYTMPGRGKIIWKAKYDAMKGLSKVIEKRTRVMSHQKVDLQQLKKMMERGCFTPYVRQYYLQQAWKQVEPSLDQS